MSGSPAFFERVRRRAAERWNQLEADPDLSGPWHQLFKQVQSPRHVLSELLQNADDARARHASVRIESGAFVFEHDGEDFNEEQFASLCRFGYSNKRLLHTIGFRGIGFKSAFSLGDVVEVYTPTLSVHFDRRRFTEPRWSDRGVRADGRTRIRVAIKDERRRREIETNLEEWRQSPLSLLFFKHIRRVHLGDEEVHWRVSGAGPVPDSEWMALGDADTRAFLLIRSSAEPFPAEALAEIRQERLLGIDEEREFPPCRVEVVLGAKGRLFVVLPTGVETTIPFACNAPFIQDPARVKIKDPETSPTNRWLLGRLGQLAAKSMLTWLRACEMSNAERARAYDLFPYVDRNDTSLDGTCAAALEESFAESIDRQAFLLTDDGSLVSSGQCVALPAQICEVWPPTQAAALFGAAGRAPLSRHVDPAHRTSLRSRGHVDDIDKQKVLTTLQERHLPRPRPWDRLLTLWTYVAREVTAYVRPHGSPQPNTLRIVPVARKDVLYAGSEVVRLGRAKLFESERDSQFVAERLLVLDDGWPRFILDRRRAAERAADDGALRSVDAADAALKRLGLDERTDASKVIDRLASEVFRDHRITIRDAVQLAQLAAKLGAAAAENFHYVTRDGRRRGRGDHVLCDLDGQVEELIPESQREALLLHPAYTQAFTSCTRDEWTKWVTTGRSGLHLCVPINSQERLVFGRPHIEAEFRKRGALRPPEYQYVTGTFVVRDWDFDEGCWEHWAELAKTNARAWVAIAERILAQPRGYWNDARSAEVFQVATTGTRRPIASEPLAPSWILRLREIACLRDTRGSYHRPGDLLRRTPETEALLDVEAFVHATLDHDETRDLLSLLGVRSSPTGPGVILDRLRALAGTDKPPIHEVERWYRRLDQMADTCSTQDLEKIRGTFRSETLILTDKGTWATVASVFMSSSEVDVPLAAVIRDSVGNLALWSKLGVAARPTVDLAIQWLKELPTGRKLSSGDVPRVRALLAAYPARVWDECRAWVNLAGEWTAVGGLCYALTRQSQVPWTHLHESVKQKTADFQRLPVELLGAAPFSALRPLSACVEDRPRGARLLEGGREQPPWLAVFASELCRVDLDAESETDRIRTLARQLVSTRWQRVSGLEVIPYIDGTPVGTARRTDVLWAGPVLYVNDLPKAKLAKRVPEEIARGFDRPEIKAALDYSFERPADDVRAYLEVNFRLAPVDPAPDAQHPEETPTRNGANSEDGSSQSGESKTPAGVLTGEATDPGPGGGSLEDPAGEPVDDPDGGNQVQGSGEGRRWPERPQVPRRPSIIERFAAARGFRRDGEGCFFHSDGSWIARTTGDRFPWERRTPSGDVVRYYWPKDHCLEQEPLVLESEIWALIDRSPELYALILTDSRGEPIELHGNALRQLRDRQKLKLYPATYRLVLESDE